jgi:hypothetical protein
MAVFLWDKFEILPATITISRRLKSICWLYIIFAKIALLNKPDLKPFSYVFSEDRRAELLT